MRPRPTAKLRGLFATVTTVALALGVSLVATQFGLAAPGDPDFTVTPQSPLPGQTVTFTATNLRPNDSVTWDFQNDGSVDATGSTAQHVYATPGARTVRMRVARRGDDPPVEVLKVVRVDSPPTASFTASPNPATAGEAVQFNAAGSSDPDGPIASYAWDLDNDGQFDDASGIAASRAFATAGTYTVRLRVTDNRGSVDTATTSVTVNAAPGPPPPAYNQPPVASFTASPNPATVGQAVQLNGTGSSDSDGTIASYAWDLDNDGQFDDASGATTSRAFAAAGSYTIRLRVTDNRGSADTAASVVTVNGPSVSPPAPPPNAPPVASFTSSPRLPLAGDAIQLVSTSSDPEGSIAGHAWDLDDDGQFDDSTSRAPVVRFGAPGIYPIRLRVTDARGAADVASHTLIVGPRAAAGVPAPELMRPFPVVRIVGRSTRGGARIRRLAIRSAPKGAKVTVRCRGRRCRLRTTSKYIRSSSARFRSFERRVPAGVRIQVFVTQPGKVGKYTSFKIRRSRPPLRTDLCVISVGAKPTRCPTS